MCYCWFLEAASHVMARADDIGKQVCVQYLENDCLQATLIQLKEPIFRQDLHLEHFVKVALNHLRMLYHLAFSNEFSQNLLQKLKLKNIHLPDYLEHYVSLMYVILFRHFSTDLPFSFFPI